MHTTPTNMLKCTHIREKFQITPNLQELIAIKTQSHMYYNSRIFLCLWFGKDSVEWFLEKKLTSTYLKALQLATCVECTLPKFQQTCMKQKHNQGTKGNTCTFSFVRLKVLFKLALELDFGGRLEFDKNFDAALKRVFFQDITLM
jgi:hypothetical protein